MSVPFANYSREDWRLIGLLGGFAFAMLAGLTALGIAAESMFLSSLGAEKMAYGIIAGQALVIPVFRFYGWLRARLSARYVTPVVVVSLLVTLFTLFLCLQRWSAEAAIALFVLLPCIAGLMTGESGRLSASLLNPRLARRLFPSIGSIGGFGASFGAFFSGWLAGAHGSDWLLPLAAGFFLLTLIPASRVGVTLRPRKPASGKARLSSNHYALCLVVAAGLIAALTTILRYQIGAAASEVYDPAELSDFYSRLQLIINLIAVAFTLFLTRATVNGLGAANSLLIYPVVVLVTVSTLIAVPSLGLVAGAVATERLIRQNVHRTVSSLAIMPLGSALRTRVALVNNGSARPVGTIAASLAVLMLTGEIENFPLTVTWQQFSHGVFALVLAILACLVVVRSRYVRQLVSALHNRRLQLDSVDAAADVLEPDVRRKILGYLTSELPERNLLALKLLDGYVDEDGVAAITKEWPRWDETTRTEAIRVLVSGDTASANTFVLKVAGDAGDPASAAARASIVAELDTDELHASAAQLTGKPKALAIATLIRRDVGSDYLESIRRAACTASAQERELAAEVIAALDTDSLDALRADLLQSHPLQILPTLARRPDPELCAAMVPFLIQDTTNEIARDALAAYGEYALEALAAGMLKPSQAWQCADLLVKMGGSNAEEHLASALQHADQRIVLVTLGALARAATELGPELRIAAESARDRAIADAVYFKSKQYPQSPALDRLASHHALFAMEIVFAALDAMEPRLPYRRLFLASQSGDTRQRALAAETLDETLPGAMRSAILDLLESTPKSRIEVERNPGWESIAERLASPDDEHTRKLDALLRCELFPGWCYAELTELLNNADAADPAGITIRQGQAVRLEEVLLTGRSPESQAGDVVVTLRQLYKTISRNPRCGGLWLRGLAGRVRDPDGSSDAVTRSEQLSLASRSLSDDERVTDSIELWQRVFFLRTMSLTQSLPPERLRLIAEISRTVTTTPGEYVVTRGRLGNHFYMVCTGSLEVLDGEKHIARLGPSDAFGAMSLMRGARRSFSVRVTEAGELLTIDRADFLDLIDGHPSLVRSFSRSLAARIRAARLSTGDATLIKQPG